VTHRRRSLLRHRPFRLLWTGETVSQAGNSMATVVVALLAVTVLRASTFKVASLAAAGSLPWLVIGLPAGAWADRLPARTLMIACDLVAAVLYASLPAAAGLGAVLTRRDLPGETDAAPLPPADRGLAASPGKLTAR
jgi:hypothetical protein